MSRIVKQDAGNAIAFTLSYLNKLIDNSFGVLSSLFLSHNYFIFSP